MSTRIDTARAELAVLAFVNDAFKRLQARDLALYRAETLELRLSVYQDGVAADLSAMDSFQLAGKDPDLLDGTDFLFNSTDTSTSSWTDKASGQLGITIDLNTDEVDAFMASASKRVSVELIETDSGGNELRILARGDALLHPDVIRGDEGSPTPGTPQYTLLNLNDTPSSYSGEAGKYIRANSGETASEFAVVSQLDAADGSPTAVISADNSGNLVVAQAAAGRLATGGLGNQGQVALGANLDQSDWLLKRDVDGGSSYNEDGAVLALQRDVTNVGAESGDFLRCLNAAGTVLAKVDKNGGATLNGGVVATGVGDFDPTADAQNAAILAVRQPGVGQDSLGGAVDFSAPQDDGLFRGGAVACVQTAVQRENTGLAFYTKTGASNDNVLDESMRLTHLGDLSITGGMTIASALNHDGATAGFFAKTPAAQPAKASYNNWEAPSDIADALAALGLVDVGGGAAKASRQLVQSGTLGGDQTNIDISSLDINTDGRYLLELQLEHAGGAIGDANLSVYFEADYTATNYDACMTASDNGSVGSATSNDSTWGYLEDSAQVTAVLEIWRDIKGNPVVAARAFGFEGASNLQDTRTFVRKQGTETNITSARIASDVASALKTGSKWFLWKVAA